MFSYQKNFSEATLPVDEAQFWALVRATQWNENIDKVLNEWITKNELGMGPVMNGLRLMLVGAGKGPHIHEILALIGKDEALKRIEKGIKVLG